VEWEGTRELAHQHAEHYGLRFAVVRRPGGDLLDAVRQRHRRLAEQGKGHVPAWMSPRARYCTSDFKRGPVRTLFTRLARESQLGRRVRILNCLGLRAEESPARSKLLPFRLDRRASNGRRTVLAWLPIFRWGTRQVWDRISSVGTRHHPAYDLGMPRLSCVFCVFAPKGALVLAGRHNRSLLDEYVKVEQERAGGLDRPALRGLQGARGRPVPAAGVSSPHSLLGWPRARGGQAR
jgi:3'-phosphoadenosine 5'-phosphosulfate sulfotransferase (PAPS reductase)/FAD synthetase